MNTKAQLLERRYPVYAGIHYPMQGKSCFANPTNPINPAQPDGTRWLEAGHGFRVLGWADELVPSYYRAHRHHGWFADDCQDAVYRGAVVALPHGRMYPAVADPWNDGCYCVDFSQCFQIDRADDTRELIDCAQAADGMAERMAEKERAFQEDEARELEHADSDLNDNTP